MAKRAPLVKPSEPRETQFDYAWKWFCFHADQRIKMFNYMLIVFGIFAAGVVNALHDEVPRGAIAGLCFIAAVLAFVFMKLDRRNRDLVWLGEDVLMELERKVIFEEGNKVHGRYNEEIDFSILWRQALQEREWLQLLERQQPSRVWMAIRTYFHDFRLGKHRILLPGIGGLIGVLFLSAGVFLLTDGLGGLLVFTFGVLALLYLSILQLIPRPR